MATISEEIEARQPRMNPEECFMAYALIIAEQSRDPETQVGACVVVEGSIVGSGYNDMPNGCESLPWSRNYQEGDDKDFLKTKYPYVCHGVLNAILSSHGNTRGGTIYTTQFPCYDCVKLIVQSGIKKVIYFTDKYEDSVRNVDTKGGRKLLEAANIDYIKYSGSKKFTLDLTDPINRFELINI